MTALLKVLFAIIAFVGVAATRAQETQAEERTAEQACPHAERWKPTAEELEQFEKGKRKRSFCWADLRGASCGARRGGD